MFTLLIRQAILAVTAILWITVLIRRAINAVTVIRSETGRKPAGNQPESGRNPAGIRPETGRNSILFLEASGAAFIFLKNTRSWNFEHAKVSKSVKMNEHS